jgi:hypothetical protein
MASYSETKLIFNIPSKASWLFSVLLPSDLEKILLCPANCQVRDETQNLKTKDVIMCFLLGLPHHRAVADACRSLVFGKCRGIVK